MRKRSLYLRLMVLAVAMVVCVAGTGLSSIWLGGSAVLNEVGATKRVNRAWMAANAVSAAIYIAAGPIGWGLAAFQMA